MNLKILFFLTFIQISFAQGNLDTVKVNGGNWVEVLRYSKYYIDTTNTERIETVGKKLKYFKKNNSSLLSLKKQPHNLWVYLKAENIGKKQKYWLGLYSQADTIIIYERNKGNNKFKFKKLSDYSSVSKKRDSIDLRFHFASFNLKQYEDVEILLLVKNRKHITNFYMDLTTPHDSLIWERGFYWTIGGFVSIFFFTAILCLFFGLFLRKLIFINYALYLIITSLFILHEELFISIIKMPWLYKLVYTSNSNFLMLIAVGLNMQIFLTLTQFKAKHHKAHFYFDLLSKFLMIFGIICYTVNYIYPNLNFLNTFFNILWNSTIFLNVLSVVLNATIIQIYFINEKKFLLGLLVGVLLIIINPVVYYLNYNKIINIYEIQHPNYYYYIILIEILLLGLFIILQYKLTLSKNIEYLNEKIRIEKDLKFEKESKDNFIKNAIFESQSKLLNNLSKDLHDDLGQKLSVINISLENLKLKFQAEEINQLKKITLEISNSIRNLSHWLNDYEFHNKEITDIIEQDAIRINRLNFTRIKITTNVKTILNTNEKIIVFRVYQELLNNSLKHGNSSEILINFYENKIVYSDNGKGLNNNVTDGIGLKNIKERLHIINWDTKLENNPEKGFTAIIYKL